MYGEFCAINFQPEMDHVIVDCDFICIIIATCMVRYVIVKSRQNLNSNFSLSVLLYNWISKNLYSCGDYTSMTRDLLNADWEALSNNLVDTFLSKRNNYVQFGVKKLPHILSIKSFNEPYSRPKWLNSSALKASKHCNSHNVKLLMVCLTTHNLLAFMWFLPNCIILSKKFLSIPLSYFRQQNNRENRNCLHDYT